MMHLIRIKNVCSFVCIMMLHERRKSNRLGWVKLLISSFGNLCKLLIENRSQFKIMMKSWCALNAISYLFGCVSDVHFSRSTLFLLPFAEIPLILTWQKWYKIKTRFGISIERYRYWNINRSRFFEQWLKSKLNRTFAKKVLIIMPAFN